MVVSLGQQAGTSVQRWVGVAGAGLRADVQAAGETIRDHRVLSTV